MKSSHSFIASLLLLTFPVTSTLLITHREAVAGSMVQSAMAERFSERFEKLSDAQKTRWLRKQDRRMSRLENRLARMSDERFEKRKNRLAQFVTGNDSRIQGDLDATASSDAHEIEELVNDEVICAGECKASATPSAQDRQRGADQMMRISKADLERNLAASRAEISEMLESGSYLKGSAPSFWSKIFGIQDAKADMGMFGIAVILYAVIAGILLLCGVGIGLVAAIFAGYLFILFNLGLFSSLQEKQGLEPLKNQSVA